MKRLRLPVMLFDLPGGRYAATCPVLEGCHAEGRTPIEAIDHMVEIAGAITDTQSPYAVLAQPHSSLPKARYRCPLF